MPCACGKNKKQHEVVLNGKVVYTSSQRHIADSVAKRCPGSTVREKPTTTAQPRAASR